MLTKDFGRSRSLNKPPMMAMDNMRAREWEVVWDWAATWKALASSVHLGVNCGPMTLLYIFGCQGERLSAKEQVVSRTLLCSWTVAIPRLFPTTSKNPTELSSKLTIVNHCKSADSPLGNCQPTTATTTLASRRWSVPYNRHGNHYYPWIIITYV